MIIYVPQPQEIDPEALALLREQGHEVRTDASAASAAEVLFVRTYTQVTAAYLADFPKLKFVLRAGVGLDNIDVAECKRLGVSVINAPGANANAVAEYTVGAIVSLLRQFKGQEAALRSGGWRQPELAGGELKGKVLGLVGCGNVARALAHKLSSWELGAILGYDPYLDQAAIEAAGIRKCELKEVLTQANIISLHVPLVPETKHLITDASFARMQPGAILINAARGGVVDEAALARALTSGTLAGAALDVFETEPTVAPELLACPNILLTPHIGGYTNEASKEVSLAPVRELLRQLSSVR